MPKGHLEALSATSVPHSSIPNPSDLTLICNSRFVRKEQKDHLCSLVWIAFRASNESINPQSYQGVSDFHESFLYIWYYD